MGTQSSQSALPPHCHISSCPAHGELPYGVLSNEKPQGMHHCDNSGQTGLHGHLRMLLLSSGKRDKNRKQAGPCGLTPSSAARETVLTLNLSMADSVLCATVLITSTALKGNFP